MDVRKRKIVEKIESMILNDPIMVVATKLASILSLLPGAYSELPEE